MNELYSNESIYLFLLVSKLYFMHLSRTIHIFKAVISILFIFVLEFETMAKAVESSSNDSLLVSEIVILGNKKTQKHVILRELTFKTGDYIPASDLDTISEINKNHIFNLHLFLEVSVVGQQGVQNNISFIIVVKERWYTILSFIVELADRSLNEWWNLYDHDLKRIEYGLVLSQQNCRGRNETFNGLLQSGFSQQLLFGYEIPYFAKNQKSGLLLKAQYLRNREFAYGTNISNELLYFRQNDFIRNRMRLDVEFSYRNKIDNTHRFNISFNKDHIADTILDLNPVYFGNKQTNQQYFSFTYVYESNKTDIHFYPRRGYHTVLEFSKLGLGIFSDVNYLNMNALFAAYKPFSERLFYAGQLSGEFSSDKMQAFLIAPNFGYHGIFVRSFEYYLVKGQAYILNRNELKYHFFSTVINFSSIQLPKFNRIPFDMYLKVFTDNGYVYDNGNFKHYDLQNKWLISAGIGLDLVTYYDMVFRFEYGLNNLNERALFLHFKKAI